MNLNAKLTKREYEIGEYTAWGYQTKEIAHQLHISTHTVVQTKKNIFEKTEVSSVGQLCAWFFCKFHNVSVDMRPVIGLFLFCLTVFTEVAVDDQDMIRASRARTSRTKTGKKK